MKLQFPDMIGDAAIEHNMTEYVTADRVSDYMRIPCRDLMYIGLFDDIPSKVTARGTRIYKWTSLARKICKARMQVGDRNHPYDKVRMEEMVRYLDYSQKSQITIKVFPKLPIGTVHKDDDGTYVFRKDFVRFIHKWHIPFMLDQLDGKLRSIYVRYIFGHSAGWSARIFRTNRCHERYNSKRGSCLVTVVPKNEARGKPKYVSVDELKQSYYHPEEVKRNTRIRRNPLTGVVPLAVLPLYLGLDSETWSTKDVNRIKKASHTEHGKYDLEKAADEYERMWIERTGLADVGYYTRDTIRRKFGKDDLWIDVNIAGKVGYVQKRGSKISNDEYWSLKAKVRDGLISKSYLGKIMSTVIGWDAADVERVVAENPKVDLDIRKSVIKYGYHEVARNGFAAIRDDETYEANKGKAVNRVNSDVLPFKGSEITDTGLIEEYPAPNGRWKQTTAKVCKQVRERAKRRAMEARKEKESKLPENQFADVFNAMTLEEDIARESDRIRRMEENAAKNARRNEIRELLGVKPIPVVTAGEPSVPDDGGMQTILFSRTGRGMFNQFKHLRNIKISHVVPQEKGYVRRGAAAGRDTMSGALGHFLKRSASTSSMAHMWVVIAHESSYIPDPMLYMKINAVPHNVGAVGAFGYGYTMPDGTWSTSPATYGLYSTYSDDMTDTKFVTGTKGVDGMHEVDVIDGPFIAIRAIHVAAAAEACYRMDTVNPDNFIIPVISYALTMAGVKLMQISVNAVKYTPIEVPEQVYRDTERKLVASMFRPE